MFSREVLRIDPPAGGRADRGVHPRRIVLGDLRRRGAVVGISGGIDSSVVAALCARALGPERVLGLLMPERDSSGDALRLGRMLAEQLGIRCVVEDIAPALAALGCYERQAEAVRHGLPRVRGRVALQARPPVRSSTATASTWRSWPSPIRTATSAASRMPPAAYLQMVAATNFKQRTRKMMAYYHADRLNFAVAGTPNLLEYDQGFFVKQGDGAADFKPIAHLYKTQVYALAEYLGVPRRSGSARRPPTPTPSPRRRRSSTSPSRTARWTCACGPSTTACPPSEVAPGHRADRGAGRARLPRHRGEAAREPLPPRTCRAPLRPGPSRVRHRRVGRAPRRGAAARRSTT